MIDLGVTIIQEEKVGKMDLKSRVVSQLENLPKKKGFIR